MVIPKLYRCVCCKKHYEEKGVFLVVTDKDKAEYWCAQCDAKKRPRIPAAPTFPGTPNKSEYDLKDVPDALKEALLQMAKNQQK